MICERCGNEGASKVGGNPWLCAPCFWAHMNEGIAALMESMRVLSVRASRSAPAPSMLAFDALLDAYADNLVARTGESHPDDPLVLSDLRREVRMFVERLLSRSAPEGIDARDRDPSPGASPDAAALRSALSSAPRDPEAPAPCLCSLSRNGTRNTDLAHHTPDHCGRSVNGQCGVCWAPVPAPAREATPSDPEGA